MLTHWLRIVSVTSFEAIAKSNIMLQYLKHRMNELCLQLPIGCRAARSKHKIIYGYKIAVIVRLSQPIHMCCSVSDSHCVLTNALKTLWALLFFFFCFFREHNIMVRTLQLFNSTFLHVFLHIFARPLRAIGVSS